MDRDRRILWAAIFVLAILTLAQIVGNRMMRHWRDSFSQPDPRFEQMGGKR